jgi:hypothetical protein
MGFTITQGKDEVQAAHRFQINTELRGVQLLECSASTSEGQAQLLDRLCLGLKMEPSVLAVSEEEARIGVGITVFGDPEEAAEDAQQHLFEVVCRYALIYRLDEGYAPAQEQLDAFKDGNAVFHCWPYARELVQNLTMRMGLPIPPLPFLRLAPKPEPKKSTAKVSTRARGAHKGTEEG